MVTTHHISGMFVSCCYTYRQVMYNYKKLAVKNIFVILVLIFILISCSNSLKQKRFFVTDLTDYGFILSAENSDLIKKHERANRKFADSCKKYNLGCLIDGEYEETAFPAGINNFRNIIIDNFKLPFNAKNSINKIQLIIDKKNKIKSVRIENTKEENVKNEISRVLNLNEIDRWKSGGYGSEKFEYFIEFNLVITNK